MVKAALLFSTALLLAVGCNKYEKRDYNVVVKNNSARPLTVGLTKSGPKFEKEWASPEDIAIINRGNAQAGWGIKIPSGRVGATSDKQGEFSGGSIAVVRMYSGELTMDEVLSIGRGSRRRADVKIAPGATLLTVTDKGDGIDVYVTRPDANDPNFAPSPDAKDAKKKKK